MCVCVCVQDNKIRWPPLSVPLSALPQSTNSLSVKNNYSNLFSFSRPPLLIIYYLSLWCVEGGLLEDDKKTKFSFKSHSLHAFTLWKIHRTLLGTAPRNKLGWRSHILWRWAVLYVTIRENRVGPNIVGAMIYCSSIKLVFLPLDVGFTSFSWHWECFYSCSITFLLPCVVQWPSINVVFLASNGVYS